MPISDRDIEILVAAAGVEITTSKLSFSNHLDAIKKYFTALAAQPNSQFKFVLIPGRTKDLAFFNTNLGLFTFTPAEALLRVPGNDTDKPISFYSGKDITASLISATVRFVERWAAHKSLPLSAAQFADRDTEILVAAARVEITTNKLPYSDHRDATERYLSAAASLPDSQFKLYERLDPLQGRDQFLTSLGVFELTPETGALVVTETDPDSSISFFSSKDVTASQISALVRFVERRSVYVNQLIRPAV